MDMRFRSAGVLARWPESVPLSAAARRRRASGRDGRAPTAAELEAIGL